MTKLPSEVDPPDSLVPDLIDLRNEALRQIDFQSAVLLSHCINWLNWLSANFEELKNDR